MTKKEQQEIADRVAKIFFDKYAEKMREIWFPPFKINKMEVVVSDELVPGAILQMYASPVKPQSSFGRQ